MSDKPRHSTDAECLRLSFAQLRYVTLSTGALVVLLAVMIRPRVPAARLWLWVAAYELVVVGRLALAFWHGRRARSDAELRQKLPLLALGLTLSAGLWGSVASVSVGRPDTVVSAIELLFAGGLIAGGTQSLIGTPKIMIACAVLMVTPLMARLVASGTTEHRYLALVAVTYLFSTFQFGRKNLHVLRESIALRFGNLDLVSRLTLEKAKAESARDVAERATDTKNQFLAAASHDIRQPLHAAFLFLGALENAAGKNAGVALERLRASLTAARQMLDTLLDVSRLDAGVVERVDAPVRALALGQRVLELFGPAAERKGLSLALRAPKDLWLLSDPTLLQRVLVNLTSNAIKYTERGAVLLVFRRRKAGCLVQVWDTGIGIPEGALDSIFDEFKQLGNPERDGSRGMGLGLSIVRRLCRMLDTEVHVRSALDRGSVFSLLLPLGVAVPDATAPEPFEAPVAKARLIVVDDDVLVREALALLLGAWGYETRVVGTVEEARHAAAQGLPPDLALVDYRLPGEKTALDAIAAICEGAGRDVPAIIITGDTHPQRIREATSLSHPVVFKPVPPDLLRRTLSAMLTRSA